MKSFLRVLVFILSFQMEVRVRASGAILEQPEACLSSQKSCTIRITGASFHFHAKGYILHAQKQSTISRVNEGEWRFIQGVLWVDKAKTFNLETLFGDIRSQDGGFWVLDDGNKIVIKNTDSNQLNIRLKSGTDISLPVGFEVWIAGIDSRGQSQYGILQPIELKTFVPLMASLFEGTKAQFKASITELQESWGDLPQKSAQIYENGVRRELAMVAESKDVAKKQRQEQIRRREEVRSLYFEKVFGR